MQIKLTISGNCNSKYSLEYITETASNQSFLSGTPQPHPPMFKSCSMQTWGQQMVMKTYHPWITSKKSTQIKVNNKWITNKHTAICKDQDKNNDSQLFNFQSACYFYIMQSLHYEVCLWSNPKDVAAFCLESKTWIFVSTLFPVYWLTI